MNNSVHYKVTWTKITFLYFRYCPCSLPQLSINCTIFLLLCYSQHASSSSTDIANWFVQTIFTAALLTECFWQVGWKARIDVQMKKACFQQESLLNWLRHQVAYYVQSLCPSLVNVHRCQWLLEVSQSPRSMIPDTMAHQEVLHVFWEFNCKTISSKILQLID